MRPSRPDIAAPDFPDDLAWANGQPGAMAVLAARGPALMHFFDFAQLNGVRTLPYIRAWHARYAGSGLSVLGVHAPRHPFTVEAPNVSSAVARLELDYPVAIDSSHRLWRAYGCRGWPSLFVFARGGALAWFHFGEGEYAATEQAIQAALRAAGFDGPLPAPLEPVRASDAPGALVAPPTDELLPGGSLERPWTAGEGSSSTLELEYAGAGAYASLDGEGSVAVALDGSPERRLAVSAPGLYELAAHPRHEAHRLLVRPTAGVRIWSLSFSAGPP